MARKRMRRQRRNHSLDTVALANEAYLKLQGGKSASISDRRHFFRLVGRVMQQILIDRARVRDGRRPAVSLSIDGVEDAIGAAEPSGPDPIDAIAVVEAIEKLETVDPVAAELVRHRLLSGIPLKDLPELMGFSLTKCQRRLQFGSAFLRKELGDEPES